MEERVVCEGGAGGYGNCVGVNKLLGWETTGFGRTWCKLSRIDLLD